MSDSVKHFEAMKSNLSTEDDDDIVESDIELDNTDVMEPDNDPSQKVGLKKSSLEFRVKPSIVCWIGTKTWSRLLYEIIYLPFVCQCRWETRQLKLQKKCVMQQIWQN